MKRKLICLLFAVLVLSVFCVPVSADNTPITVILDGNPLAFEVPPIIDNGRVLVPMRAIFEAMGAVVTWDASSGTATAVKNDTTVKLVIGSVFPTINGEAKTLDVPPQIVNGRTLAPLRFVGEAFGGSVVWNPDTCTVSISSGVPYPFEYETYTNDKFQYSMPYPNIFDASLESDAGDGVTMETAGGLYRLKIWGAYNTDNSTGKDLLAEAQKRVSDITSQDADDTSYNIEYLGGGNGQEITFSEAGYVAGDKIIAFVISYPSQEKDKFDEAIARMMAGVRNDDPALQNTAVESDYNPLINALCLSESLHYDKFVDEPDSITTSYTIFDLVSKKYFPWNEQLQPVDGAYFFSSGPENENGKVPGAIYISPDYLYQDFFAVGTYPYPPADIKALVEGTQTGIEVHLVDIPYSADAQIKNVSEKNNEEVINATISRVNNDGSTPKLLGNAVITLKKDSTAYLGYKIVSFEPSYSQFDDIKLQ